MLNKVMLVIMMLCEEVFASRYALNSEGVGDVLLIS